MSEPTQPSLLPLILIGVALWYFSQGSGKPVAPDPGKPSPVVVEKDKPTPAECWEALAKCVESKWIGGTMQQHTDHILGIVDSLKQSGSITDDARVAEWRARRTELTDSNRAAIAAKLRGK